MTSPTAVFNDLSLFNMYIDLTPADIKMLNLNIRSIRKNFSELCSFLESLNFYFDIIVLTESWLCHNSGYDITGYKKCVKINKYNKCDGVVVYFRDNLSFSLIDLEINFCNSIHFTFTKNDVLFNLTAIYRSPNLCANEFLTSLESFLKTSKGRTHIITGDINIQILENCLDLFGNRYLNMMHEHGFTRYLNATTRSSKNSNSCLDHIFFKTDDNLAFNSGVYNSAITDHYMTFSLITSSTKKSSRQPSEPVLNVKHTINYNSLLLLVKNTNWCPILNCRDAESSFEIFYNTLRSLINKCTVIFHTPSKLKKIKPWITTGIVKSIRTRDTLAKQMKQDPNNTVLLNRYKKYRNTLTNIIRQMKITYYSEKFSTHQNNPKKFWQTVNEATDTEIKSSSSIIEIINNNGSTVRKSKDIANEFNKYFTCIGHNIVSKIRKTQINPNIVENTVPSSSMFLFPIDEDEIISLVKSLKNNVAPGIDGITNKTLKIIAEQIAKPLTHVFNLCISQGVFPATLKYAVVVPLHKSGDRKNLNNYRPISLLPSLSKLFEKCIKFRLMNYLEKHKFLSKNQFGFRNNLSTDDALMNVTSKIIEELDNGKKCLGIFLDIQKAFDTVNHTILFNKLDSLGIRGTALKLFKSYLNNRLQITKINYEFSDRRNINIGVPQGTVLGPTLFLIYINDLLNIKLEKINGHLYSYADDTAVIFSGINWNDVYESANTGMVSIKEWLDRNLLCLNI